jgi:hypothetical protein
MARNDRKKSTTDGTRVSMSCLAEFVTSYGRSPESRLRPYKFNKRGEGFARTSYYQSALRTIRAYHSEGNDPAVFERGLLEMRTRADKATENWERTKSERNISAVQAYRRIYRNRKFEILPNRRLEYRIGGIIVTAQPDLWAEEQGTQVLLKIGMARHKISYVDMLLFLLRKAAVSGGYKIRARNIVYLNVSTGREMICSGGLARFNSTFAAGAREIAGVWQRMKTDTPPSGDQSEARP